MERMLLLAIAGMLALAAGEILTKAIENMAWQALQVPLALAGVQ